MPFDSAEPEPDQVNERPTMVRHVVVGLATAMAVLLYLDRFCLGFLVPFMVEEFSLRPEQRGVLLSVFFWAYALAQVPSGWLTDRFGSRLMLTLYIVLWSLFTGLMGAVQGFLMVLVLRFGCGLAQAGAYPTGASMISKWVPFAGRGQASGIVSVGGRLGGFLAPVLTAYLLLMFVPVSTSSLLTEADLLQPQQLLEDLKSPGEKPTKDHSQKPAGELKDAGTKARTQVVVAIRGLVPESLTYVQNSPSEQQTALLVATLNEVLQMPELFAKVDLSLFDLPAEGRQLAEIPPAELTREQVTRRNRLLLEAAFHDGIRKIYGQGWRPVVLVYGLLGLLVAGAFWLWVRDRPRQHPACNAAEIALIEGKQQTAGCSDTAHTHICRATTVEKGDDAIATPGGCGPQKDALPNAGQLLKPAADRAGALPLIYLLQSPNMWCSSVAQFGTNFGWSFLLLMLPTYLLEVHRLTPLEVGWLSGLPVLVGMIGMVLGGWLTDRLTLALGVRWGRGLPMASTRFLAMAAYLCCLFLDAPLLLIAAFCVVALATDLGTAALWAFNQDVAGRYVGSVLGWGNMWGNVGAAVSPLVLFCIEGSNRWEYRFLACALAFLVAGISALCVDARIPVIPVDSSTRR
jgi:MFS family permease